MEKEEKERERLRKSERERESVDEKAGEVRSGAGSDVRAAGYGILGCDVSVKQLDEEEVEEEEEIEEDKHDAVAQQQEGKQGEEVRAAQQEQKAPKELEMKFARLGPAHLTHKTNTKYNNNDS